MEATMPDNSSKLSKINLNIPKLSGLNLKINWNLNVREGKIVYNPNLTEQVKEINALKGKRGVEMIRESGTPAPEPTDNGFRANPNLINKQLAMRSHAGTSFDPEKRGEQEIAEFVSYVQDVYERLKKHAITDRQKEYLLTEIERFQSSFASKYNAKLSAQGSCLSTMIAGPSNFPARRAQKACSAADKRYEELIEFRDRAEAAILRELKKMGVEEAGGEIEVLKKKIVDAERNHEFMVKANVIVRKKIPDDQKIREIMALGKISETTVRQILKPDYMGRVGFPDYALSNDTANIRRMKERLKELEKKEVTPTAEIPFTGGYIIDNREADRVQIVFDQRPSQEMITKLKSEGWRWSPANTAWQRKRTDAAMYSARRITGAVQPAPAVQPAITPVPVPVPAARPEPLAGLEADVKAYRDINKSIQELQKQFESTGRFPPEYTATKEAQIKAYDKIIKYYIDEIRKIPASKGMTYNQILSAAERAALVAIGASPQSVNLLGEIEHVLEKKITPEHPKPVPVEPELRWVYGTQDGKWHLVGPDDRDYAHGITQERMKTIGEELAKAEYLSPALARAAAYVPPAKYKLGQMVYSYQNPTTAAPIINIHLSNDPLYPHNYVLRIPGSEGKGTKNSNYISEKSLSDIPLRTEMYIPPKYPSMLYPAPPEEARSEPWKITQEEYWRTGAGGKAYEGRGASDFAHKSQVIMALAQGKTVGGDVLKDYPDIVARIRQENEALLAKEMAERERLLAIERAEENELNAELNKLPPALKRHAETEIYGTLHLPDTHKDYRNRYYIALGMVRKIAFTHLPAKKEPQIPQPAVQPQALPSPKIQTIQDIRQQVIQSIREAKSMDELRQILKGLGFLPLPEPDKRQLMDMYQIRLSELTGELKFGERITEEEKRKKRRAPQKAAYAPARRLEEFGIKEAMRRGYGYA